MPKVAIRIPNDLKKKMDDHEEIDWDELIQRFIKKHLSRIELANSLASKSKMTSEEASEIGDKIKKGIAEKHGLVR